MAGFGKVTFIGEYFNQSIVNCFWFRSNEWLSGQGNPFDDVLAFVDTVLLRYKATYLACLPTDYTLLRAEGVGYNDGLGIVTASPLVRTVNENGGISGASNGAAPCAIIDLRCGEVSMISGVGNTMRNRGYVAIGPIVDGHVDSYSHITPGLEAVLNDFAQNLDDTLTCLSPSVSLIPIRIHSLSSGLPKFRIPKTGKGRSDVLGYSVRRVASYRRSREPEA
jgi:hypothetical protein